MEYLLTLPCCCGSNPKYTYVDRAEIQDTRTRFLHRNLFELETWLQSQTFLQKKYRYVHNLSRRFCSDFTLAVFHGAIVSSISCEYSEQSSPAFLRLSGLTHEELVSGQGTIF